MLVSSVLFVAPLHALADKEPPPKTEISKAEAERYVVFFNKLIDTIVATKDDCAKMTSQLNGLIDANAALLKQMNSPAMKDKEVPKADKDKMQERVDREMLPALKKCLADKGVKAAFARMSQ